MGNPSQKERFLKTVRFENIDRPPLWEFGFWEETLERWKKEGLQEFGIKDFLGLDEIKFFNPPFFVHVLNLEPPFEEEIFEDTSDYKIYRDNTGITKKEFKNKMTMPLFLKYPIENKNDWMEFKKRLDPYSSDRYPTNWEDIKSLATQDCPLTLFAGSLFGLLRDWIGVENFSIMFYDEPAFVEEMIEYLTDFFIQSTNRVLQEVRIDHAHFWEDMAYKNGPLISPEMVKKFMLPGYKKIMEHLRTYNIDVFSVDCDGNVDELIPIWLEAGINGILPCEVAAGMDMVSLRKKYGNNLWMAGGIDKRALISGKKAIKKEVLGKVPYLLKTGGYIPTIDHGVPPDVSLDNYCYYLKILKEIMGI